MYLGHTPRPEETSEGDARSHASIDTDIWIRRGVQGSTE
jgi:hypothetical protein